MEILTDSLHRKAYATDASAYREMPLGVAYPSSSEDIRWLIAEARRRGCCLIPRAGGTSVAGQVVGSGIVVDISRHLNHILEINADHKWVRVEPGVVRDELNIALAPYGLFFSPETSTSNRCCIGGMVGNNSCGTHSLVYGSTRHHVLQIKGLLSDGTAFDTSVPGSGFLEKKIYAQLQGWRDNEAISNLIKENYPDTSLRRRSCGYAIDEAIFNEEGIDLCPLICGSEGTLCFITEIKLSLDPIPPKEKMVLCAHFDTLEKSFEANLIALKHNPVAIELMDGKILQLSRGNAEALKNSFFVNGDPASLLISEFSGPSMEASADALEKELEGKAYTCTRVYGADVAKVWALRKAGLGVLSGMKGDAKPVGVIEDTAVAPSRLPAYMKDFREMLSRLGLECVFYGHISTGELHLRPILNLKTADGLKAFRDVARETALLVRRHKGSLSGEHGDGRLRGEFIPLMYGQECYRLMREVKQCWDPDGIFNIGKIVDTPGMDEYLRFTVDQRYRIEEVDTYFNWRAAFDECKVEGASGVRSQAHALMCSIEQCNGAGECRKSKLIGGTMCPTFKISGDELKSTRARANVLRECLTSGKGFDDPDIEEILEECLACKGCRGECPSNVDMTRLRAEILQQRYDLKGTPFRSWAVARMATVEKLGHAVYPIYNFFASNKISSSILKKILRFASERQIPSLSRRTMKQLVSGMERVSSGRRVYLFADEFTSCQEAELGLKFALLLNRLGYETVIPKHIESGRAAISKGCLKLARKTARRNVSLLHNIISEETPLVGIEPSCILSFRDEYPDLVEPSMRQEAVHLGRNALLYDEFLMREIEAGHISASSFRKVDMEIWLHGHCHQKALVGIAKTASLLQFIPGATVHTIKSSCCGMAGSFGYEKEHYRTSLAIGEMMLFPAIRGAGASSWSEEDLDGRKIRAVAAPGTSCRQQIKDGTGIRAAHPIEILYACLAR